MLIYGIISGILVLVIVGIFMLVALGIFSLIVTIIAAVKAASGVRYRYPMTIRFVN